MEIFIDTSNIGLIKKWNNTGLISGVTTNPALLSQQKGDPKETLSSIASIMKDRPVSAQVTMSSSENMIAQGIALSKISKNIIIKLPANYDGYLSLLKLKSIGIKTNITLCFDPVSAAFFSMSGATYVSMIMGRTDDFNLQQPSLIERTKKIFINMNAKAKILGASFRTPHQVELAMSQGADILTIPPQTLEMLFNNPLTKTGLADFKTSWETLDLKVRENYEKS